MGKVRGHMRKGKFVRSHQRRTSVSARKASKVAGGTTVGRFSAKRSAQLLDEIGPPGQGNTKPTAAYRRNMRRQRSEKRLNQAVAAGRVSQAEYKRRMAARKAADRRRYG